MEIDEVIEQYHDAAREFSKGNPDPVKRLLSDEDDVTLANPFGPAVRGGKEVRERLDLASSRFREGDVPRFEAIAKYVDADLATILENESWETKVGDRSEPASFELRVSTTFRREGGRWKLVHRHADPITSEDPEGPLRSS